MPDGHRPAEIAPEHCASLEDARAQIDRVDAAILALLAQRQAYVTVVARHKPLGEAVRDPIRVEAMAASAREQAARLGVDPQLAEDIRRCIAEASARFQERRAAAAPSPGDKPA